MEILLLNRELIRAKEDIDSDAYIDLIQVERTLDSFSNNKTITPNELRVLNTVLNTPNFFYAEKELGMDRDTVSKIFRVVCDRVSYKLGDYFTDEGYIDYMADKYNLSCNQANKLSEYMNSKYRYRLGRRIFEDTQLEVNPLSYQ